MLEGPRKGSGNTNHQKLHINETNRLEAASDDHVPEIFAPMN